MNAKFSFGAPAVFAALILLTSDSALAQCAGCGADHNRADRADVADHDFHDLPEVSDSRSTAQRDFEAGLEVARKVSERQEADRTREQMRDKTHDNRVGLGEIAGREVSVGASEKGVDIRMSTDPKKPHQ